MKNSKLISVAAVCAALLWSSSLLAGARSDPALIGLPGLFEGGPGNSVAARDSDPYEGSQPNCVGAWISTAARNTQGLDVPENNEPGGIVEGISTLFTLAAIALSETQTPDCSTFAPQQ